jgi:hypothetical protein
MSAWSSGFSLSLSFRQNKARLKPELHASVVYVPAPGTNRYSGFAIKPEINHNHANPKRHFLTSHGF